MPAAQAAIIAMTLENMESSILAAAYLALTGFGRIDQKVPAYKPMLEAELITAQGNSTFDHATLLEALSFVIATRLAAQGKL